MLVSEIALRINNIDYRWADDSPLIEDFSLTLALGQSLLIHGASGSGKSTLLSLIGGVIEVSRGDIQILGQPFSSWGAARRDRFRADHMGFIFQAFNLLPYLSVLDNVLLPCRFSKQRMEKAGGHRGSVNEAERLLTALGLAKGKFTQAVNELSIGQQQRVAAARALIGQPAMVIADEPTSALDDDFRDQFIDLVFTELKRYPSTLLLVSHDHGLKPHFDQHLAWAVPAVTSVVG